MITGVFGLPGAGKTTFLTWLTLRALGKKPLYIGHLGFKKMIGECRTYDRVYSNVPIDGTYKLTFEHLGKVDFSDCLIIIDEAASLCDSRAWKDFDNQLRDWIMWHRHYHCDLVYCSQALDIDKKIRDRTALVFLIEKVGSFSRISTVLKKWEVKKSVNELYSKCPPLACTWLYRPFYYSAFDSFAAPELPKNPAPLWSDIAEVKKFIPLYKQYAEKLLGCGRKAAAAVRRIAAAVKRKIKHGRKRENDIESMDY